MAVATQARLCPDTERPWRVDGARCGLVWAVGETTRGLGAGAWASGRTREYCGCEALAAFRPSRRLACTAGSSGCTPSRSSSSAMQRGRAVPTTHTAERCDGHAARRCCSVGRGLDIWRARTARAGVSEHKASVRRRARCGPHAGRGQAPAASAHLAARVHQKVVRAAEVHEPLLASDPPPHEAVVCGEALHGGERRATRFRARGAVAR